MTTRNKKCEGCGRCAAACWTMPCLVLETALASGVKAVNNWCKKSGAPFTVESK